MSGGAVDYRRICRILSHTELEAQEMGASETPGVSELWKQELPFKKVLLPAPAACQRLGRLQTGAGAAHLALLSEEGVDGLGTAALRRAPQLSKVLVSRDGADAQTEFGGSWGGAAHADLHACEIQAGAEDASSKQHTNVEWHEVSREEGLGSQPRHWRPIWRLGAVR